MKNPAKNNEINNLFGPKKAIINPHIGTNIPSPTEPNNIIKAVCFWFILCPNSRGIVYRRAYIEEYANPIEIDVQYAAIRL